MLVIHTTHEGNRESILKHGVAVRFSRGAYRRVWVHKPHKRRWAVDHVSKRHKQKKRDIIHVFLNVPESWLTWFGEGVYWCDRDIPPAHIDRIEEAS